MIAAIGAERYRPAAIDYPGSSFGAGIDAVLAAAADKFALCGYSAGGRLALHVALAAPERVTRLILVSATAGISDPEERARRRDADERLARRIERWSPTEFAEHWQAQPIFAGTRPAAARLWRQDLLRSDPAELAATLRGSGTGAMEPLWDRLDELTMPSTVVAGERDERYVAIGRHLSDALPGASGLVVIPSAGHGVARDAPEALARAIEDE